MRIRDVEIVRTPMGTKRHYNYILAYPEGYIAKDGTDLSGIVFYAGKGTVVLKKAVQRIDIHEMEVRWGYHKSRKHRAIIHIHEQDLQVQKQVVYETDVEKDALLYEWACINMIYAGPYLTNSVDNLYEQGRRQEVEKRYLKRISEEGKRKSERTYTLSEQSQGILLSLSLSNGLSPLEILELLIVAKKSEVDELAEIRPVDGDDQEDED